jgi:hypothetical protein
MNLQAPRRLIHPTPIELEMAVADAILRDEETPLIPVRVLSLIRQAFRDECARFDREQGL